MPFYVTVRTVNRSHRLVPTKEVCQLIWYCLSVTVEEFRDRGEIQLYEFMFSSNEYYLLGIDLAGRLPDFIRDLNSLLSRALNELRKIRGANIEEGYDLVEVRGEPRVIEHALHALASPVRTNQVKRCRQWKSVSSLNMKYGVPKTVRRPNLAMWDDRNKRVRTVMPETATLVLDRPPVMEDLSDDELRRYIRHRLEAVEETYARARRDKGTKVLGWEAAVRRNFFEIPPKPEPTGEYRPEALEGFSKEEEEARRALNKQREPFFKKYRAALKEFVKGVRDTLFPHGTWLMRVRFDCACEPCESG